MRLLMPGSVLLKLLLVIALLCAGSLRAAEPQVLEPDKAFQLSVRAASPTEFEVTYRVASGYYLYRDKFAFSVEPSAGRLGTAVIPAGQRKKDEFFGEVETLRGDVRIRIPFEAAGAPESVLLTAVSQGCADVGVCYVPQEQKVRVAMNGMVTAAVSDAGGAPFLSAPRGAAPADESLVSDLFQGSFWLLVVSFFGFGLLLSLTPCMLPMVPILSSIVVGHGSRLTRRHAVMLSCAYVLGMAITYAIGGVAAGLSGALLSATLQNPWVLGSFAAIFLVLAGGMFGFYQFQLPVALQQRLATQAQSIHGGHYSSVFVMGSLSALIMGPCVAAPLAGALLYISQSRDVVLGGSALFAMGLGMGMPLIVVGSSAGALLPRSGPWMQTINRFFGVVLVAVAIWMVSPLISIAWQMAAWAALLILAGIHLRALDPLPRRAGAFQRVAKGVGVVALVAGVAYLIGALSGSRDLLQPLSGLRAARDSTVAEVAFERVNSLAELNQRVATAGRPVMLDFYADWCISCKEMERFTFTDQRVRDRMRQMLVLQADVTANTAEHQALLQRFRLFGPPGIVFFDASGRELRTRVIGFQKAADFAGVLDTVLGAS